MALEEHQWRTCIVSAKANHTPHEDGVVSTFVNGFALTLEYCKGIGKRRRAELCWNELNAIKTMLALTGKTRRDAFMLRA